MCFVVLFSFCFGDIYVWNYNCGQTRTRAMSMRGTRSKQTIQIINKHLNKQSNCTVPHHNMINKINYMKGRKGYATAHTLIKRHGKGRGKGQHVFAPSNNLHCTPQHDKQQTKQHSSKGEKGYATAHTRERTWQGPRQGTACVFNRPKTCTVHRSMTNKPNSIRGGRVMQPQHTLIKRRGKGRCKGQHAFLTVQKSALYTAA
jgi:hypothetical protein